MILSPNAIFAAQIFLEKDAPQGHQYQAMIEVQTGQGAVELVGFATPQDALEWLRDKISATGPSGLRLTEQR